MLKGDTDTDTDTLISEISIPIPIPILFKYRISILIRYRYDTFGQKYRNFDTDTIVSKVSGQNVGGEIWVFLVSLATKQGYAE